MKRFFKYTLPVLALCALVSCSEDTTGDSSIPVDPNVGKELIAFSPEGNGITRATGDPTGFVNDTKVVMRIKAQNGTEADWDDYRYTQAIMTAAAQVNDDECKTWGLNTYHSHLSYIKTPTNYTRYWDDAFGRASKLTVYAVAVPNKTNASTLSDNILDHDIDGTKIKKVDANTNSNWYTINSSATENTKITWTVSKVQTPSTMEIEDLSYSNNISEGITNDSKMKGRYHQAWDGSSWTKSMVLGRLAWQQKSTGSTEGVFDMGHLVFQHALTYLEFNLTEGAGFNNSGNTDFVWTNKPTGSEQSFRLIGFPITGKLDLSKALNAEGMWTPTTPTATTDDIIQLKETRSADGKTVIKLEGYVIPGTELNEVNTNLLEFEIDDAKYYVTGEQIATAILAVDANKTKEAAKTMAGKHYIINLTVNKKQIDNITAAVLPWEDVTADNVGNKNTYCHFSFEDRDNKFEKTDAPKFNIYRKGITIENYIDNDTPANYAWETGYEGPATKDWVDEGNTVTTDDHWKTNWYWLNNKTYYHFRAAGYTENKSGTPSITIEKNTSTNPNTDYFTIAAGDIGGSTYKDYIWGAPFTHKDNSYKMKYTSAKGFNNDVTIDSETVPQISKAIGATDDRIKMLLFHMTSQIVVNLTTTTGDDKVTLKNGTSGTTVKIVNFLPTGKVLMGTGAVSADGTRNTAGVNMTTDNNGYTEESGEYPAKFENFTYGMVPQPLTYDTDKHIGLEITTPDGNTYYVRDLSSITGSLTPNNLLNPYSGSADAYLINEWFPHYKYIYNITLKKKGILNITAAILPWEVVNGKNINIDLEN